MPYEEYSSSEELGNYLATLFEGGYISGAVVAGVTVVLVALIIWSVVWKGLALWKSARAGQKGWFIFFLFVNTAGLLEILYILAFQNKPEEASTTEAKEAH